MVPFRCQLCGETYLGASRPDRCPFCGAAEHHLVAAAEWIDYARVEMSGESRDLCRKAVDLEISNSAFYALCAKNSETRISKAIFKRLAKQELEHAELLADMLGMELPEAGEEKCSEADSENFEESHRRESRAIKFYLGASDKAAEARVAEVFRSISEVEGEHLKMSNIFK